MKLSFYEDSMRLAHLGQWEHHLVTSHTYWSDSLFTIFDVPKIDPSGLITFQYMDLISPDDRPFLQKAISDALEFAKPYELEHRVILKGGQIKWMLSIGQPVIDDGKVIGLKGIFQDITRQRGDRESLFEAKALFQTLGDNVPGLIYQFYLKQNQEMGFLYMSEGGKDLYEETIHDMLHDFNLVFGKVHSEDLPSLNESILNSASTLTRFKWEGRFCFPEGRIKWIQAASSPRLMPDQTIIWDGLMMDVSEKKDCPGIG